MVSKAVPRRRAFSTSGLIGVQGIRVCDSVMSRLDGAFPPDRHVPPGPPVGLVLNLHGGGGTGVRQQGLTDFDAVAESRAGLTA